MRLGRSTLCILLFIVSACLSGCDPAVQLPALRAAIPPLPTPARTQWGINAAGAPAEALSQVTEGSVVRLWDTDTVWAKIEPERGVFDFRQLDSYVAAASARHARIILVLGMTPQWARPDVPVDNYTGGVAAAPADMNDWQQFVQTVAGRYEGRIWAYEPWNEPDLPRYWHDLKETMPGLVEMSRIMYETVKTIDPDVLVASPAFSRIGVRLFDRWLTAGGDQYMDALSYHPYGHNYDPADIGTITRNFRQVLDRHSLTVPLWATELSWQLRDLDTHAQIVPPEAARELMIRTLAEIAQLNLAVVVWYSLGVTDWVNLIEYPDCFVPVLP